MTEVSSPCIRNCCLDAEDVCLGCFRNITEICAWTSYTDEERASVLVKCKTREVELISKQNKAIKANQSGN